MMAINRNRTNRQPSGRERRGSILVTVLVVVLMLSLAAYTFTEMMVAERQATEMFAREVAACSFADSGIELAAVLLGNRSEAVLENYYHNPELFQAVLMRDSEADRGRGRFSIVAPVENDTSGSAIRYGLIDESGKLNLNTLLKLGLEDEQLRDSLLQLPEMSIETADAILDWLDEDEQPRESGAENEYYETLSLPYSTKNGPLESLDELLKVRDVTSSLLFGEDSNRNGLLNPNENDGDASPPLDNADGVLQLGWSAYVTVYSRETNLKLDGTQRIDVNQQDLVELFDTLKQEFDEETAQFVAAYRLYGPYDPDADTNGNNGSNTPGQTSQSFGGGPNSQPRGSGNQPEGSGSQSGSSGSGSSEESMRGGLYLSGEGQNQVNSLYDLIGAQVRGQVAGEETTLESPWADDPSEMQGFLPELLDVLATTSEEFIEGRVNISQARREVLLGIPEMDEQLVKAILAAQAYGVGGDLTGGSRATTGWLLIEGLVELEQMRKLDKYITLRGDVFRVQVVGYYDAGGPVSRLEAVIDASQAPPKIVSFRDLTDLGWGYSRSLLQSSGTGF